MLVALLAVTLAGAAPPPQPGAAAPAQPGPAPKLAPAATLTAHDGLLVLDAGVRRDSHALIGAALLLPLDGKLVAVQLDTLTPAEPVGQGRSALWLHAFTLPATDAAGRDIRVPLCDADAQGRNAAVPVGGTLDAHGRHVPDPAKFFLACTSGAVGKCLLWGYPPWGRAPDGSALAATYQACLHMVRADYGGDDTAHTKDGTTIDIADIHGIQRFESADTAVAGAGAMAFEAGWGPAGAVCVARVRWPELGSRAAMVKHYPGLDAPCDEARARAKGALLLTRVVVR